MNITSFSREEITQKLEAAKKRVDLSESVRIIFAPQTIHSINIDEVSNVYAHLGRTDYDTVVIVETHDGNAEKKLPMPSFKFVDTALGDVEANDNLRNDFADEDDDFFINDDAFDEDVSLYNQLMMLQCALDDFKVLSIQITDERSFYVKELVSAISEILASKNVLIVFCCDLKPEKTDELKQIVRMFEAESESELMNYLNGGLASVDGLGAFICGLLVAKNWNLRLCFEALDPKNRNPENLLTGFADMQRELLLK